uniref:Pentatricopeptide repeat-containing protein n=1 Tax=Opuntia streptacantha TaxID=393608 RepID=A0A7C9AGG0_OPUST
MKLVRLVQRPIFRSFSSSICFDSNKLLTAKKPELLTKIISILEKSDPIEPALDQVERILDPDIVSTVFSHRPSPQLGFRFLIWAMKRKWLQTWKLNNYIADMFVNENEGFELWWDTLEELRRCGINIPPDAFLVLVLGYWKAGNVEKAVESFENPAGNAKSMQ